MTAFYDAELAAVDGLDRTARAFKFGLQRIIDGIESFITEASR